MLCIFQMEKVSRRVNKAILALSVSLCAIAITELDVIKRLERVAKGCVPMDGVEQIVDKV